MTHYPRDSSYKFRCSLTSCTTDNFYQRLGQLPRNFEALRSLVRLSTWEFSPADQPVIDTLQLTDAYTDVILSLHAPISHSLSSTSLAPTINPRVNDARERARIPRLEHALPRQRKLTGRRQGTTRQNRDHAVTQRLKNTEPLHLDPSRMHIEIRALRGASHLLSIHKSKANRMRDDPSAHESIRLGPQLSLGRTSPCQGQLDGASMRTEAQRPQNRRLICLA